MSFLIYLTSYGDAHGAGLKEKKTLRNILEAMYTQINMQKWEKTYNVSWQEDQSRNLPKHGK